MNNLSLNPVDLVFRLSIRKVCNDFKLAVNRMTLRVVFLSSGKLSLHVCENDIPQKVIQCEDLMHAQMIGMRFDAVSIKELFWVVHNAFMSEYQYSDPKRISLILYESLKAQCACIGILCDQKPVKSLRVADIFHILDLGKEQLN